MRIARRYQRLVLTDCEAAVFPIGRHCAAPDAQPTTSGRSIAAEEIHHQIPANFGAGDRWPVEPQAEQCLPECCSGARGPSQQILIRRRYGIGRAAVEKGVKQQHTGERYRKLVRCFYLGLRLFTNTLLGYAQTFFERGLLGSLSGCL